MKQCNFCNAELEQDAKFCTVCGMSVAEAQPETNMQSIPQEAVVPSPVTKEKKKKKPVLFISIGAAVCLVVLLIVGIVALVPSDTSKADSKYIFPESNLMTVYSPQEKKSKLLNNTNTVTSLSKKFYTMESSMDGKVRILYDFSGDVYVGTTGSAEKLTTDELLLCLAESGNAVAYVAQNGSLYLQSIPLGEDPVLIAENIYMDGIINSVAISPDGKTVAYVANKTGNQWILYVYHNGKSKQIGSGDYCPIGLSNDGEYIYCYGRQSQTLYIANADGEIEVLANYWGLDGFAFNSTHTQMMFLSSEDWYVVEGSNSPVALQSNTFVLPGMLTPAFSSTNNMKKEIDIVTYGVEDLRENYYHDYDWEEVYYLDEDWELHLISDDLPKSEGCCLVSRDGETIYYLDGEWLYRATGLNKKKLRIASDVKKFVISSDGKSAYYIDEDDTLWYWEEDKAKEEIADDIFDLQITHDDYALYIVEEDGSVYTENSKGNSGGELYACKQGKNPKRLTSSAYKIVTTGAASYYYANYVVLGATYDLYGATSGTSFSRIMSDADYSN